MTCNPNASYTFSSKVTNRTYNIINLTHDPLSCCSSNIVYLISCSRCGVQYVGETSERLNLRMNNHRTALRAGKNTLLTEHFTGEGGCCITHCTVQPIEQILPYGTDGIKFTEKELKRHRVDREAFWIKELRTLTPYGLNDRLDGHNWRYRWRDDIAGKCFNTLVVKR